MEFFRGLRRRFGPRNKSEPTQPVTYEGLKSGIRQAGLELALHGETTLADVASDRQNIDGIKSQDLRNFVDNLHHDQIDLLANSVDEISRVWIQNSLSNIRTSTEKTEIRKEILQASLNFWEEELKKPEVTIKTVTVGTRRITMLRDQLNELSNPKNS